MKPTNRLLKLGVAGAAFTIAGLIIAHAAPTLEIGWVIGILLFTVYLFVFEVVPIDVAAMSVMVFLGLTSLIAPLMGLQGGLTDINNLFIGFSSNAVMSIIAVMIIGHGLDKTGIMNIAARHMMRLGGRTESRVIALISGSVGIISGFMQNVGAAALFLPVVGRISNRANIPISRLLMPMGFCAILGGTLTLVGSSPLILLNDLIMNANQHLAPAERMQPFGLFSVTPIGLAMVSTGILYFIIFGRFVLPGHKKVKDSGGALGDYYQRTYGLDYQLREMRVAAASPLIGQTLDEFETRYRVRTIAVTSERELRMGANGILPQMEVKAGDVFALIGVSGSLDRFADEMALEVSPEVNHFAEILSPDNAGLAELVISPASAMVGESARDLKLRSTQGISTLAIIRNDGTHREGDDVRNIPFAAGDTVITFSTWDNLYRLDKVRGDAVVTSDYPQEEVRSHKALHAFVFLVIALSLVLFTDLRLSVALLVGAIGMIITGVLEAEEAYYAVSWKTVFLLASLIPLGAAVESSGTAAWIADQLLNAIGETETWVLQLAIALLATLFTLVMSNVGATVLLVPLAINIALSSGADPAMFALTVALATSNSFIIPTHQVNALIMGPGGYSVRDFFRAGGIMTILFLGILMVALNVLY
ncbi:SLC13 family permease [Gammaproteobacteria bacterium]|nr:SLC13 family permease [Gammaproteobacteria bacterium]